MAFVSPDRNALTLFLSTMRKKFTRSLPDDAIRVRKVTHTRQHNAPARRYETKHRAGSMTPNTSQNITLSEVKTCINIYILHRLNKNISVCWRFSESEVVSFLGELWTRSTSTGNERVNSNTPSISNIQNVCKSGTSPLSWSCQQLRQVSWCVTVIVVSINPVFLVTLDKWSLKKRLLVWSTKLLVVTRQPPPELRHLLTSYWTFSMMNAVMLNLEDTSNGAK